MREGVADGWDDVTAAQAQAIAALMTKPSVRAAAKSVGVGERTLYAWMKQPAFRRHFRDARKAVVDDSVLRLQKLTGAAVDAFKRSLACGIPAIELRAAQLVLGTAIEVQGLQDMADDLADLNLKMDAAMDKRASAGAAVGGDAATAGGRGGPHAIDRAYGIEGVVGAGGPGQGVGTSLPPPGVEPPPLGGGGVDLGSADLGALFDDP